MVEDAVVSLCLGVISISELQLRMVGWANVVAEICLGVAAIKTVMTSQFSQRKSRHLERRVARRFISLFLRTIVHSAMIS